MLKRCVMMILGDYAPPTNLVSCTSYAQKAHVTHDLDCTLWLMASSVSYCARYDVSRVWGNALSPPYH